MDWLHQAQIARQNPTRHSQMKKLLVLSGFLHQKFAEKLKEVGQSPDCPRAPEFHFVYKNLVLSGSGCQSVAQTKFAHGQLPKNFCPNLFCSIKQEICPKDYCPKEICPNYYSAMPTGPNFNCTSTV